MGNIKTQLKSFTMAKKATGDYNNILDMYSAQMKVDFIKVEPSVLNVLWGGGINLGSMYSIWGPEGSGKSTLAWQASLSFLKQNYKVWVFDSEKALNENQQKSFGLFPYFESGQARHFTLDTYLDAENLLKAMMTMPDSELPSLVITDSETMLQPAGAEDMSVLDNQPGVKAKQANLVLNMMKQFFHKKKIASIIIFHARANISMKGGAQEEMKSAGGYAALHIPDVRTRVIPGPRVLENPSDTKSQQIGVVVRIMCEKNKFTAPRVTYERSLIYGKGIDKRRERIDYGLETNQIQKEGQYFVFPNGSKHRGFVALYDAPTDDLKSIKVE